VIRHGPNKLVFSSQKALNGMQYRIKDRLQLTRDQDIYQNERTNKVTSYLNTQIKPNTYSVFNCIDKRLHRIKRRMISKALSEQKMRQFEPILLQHIDIFLKQLLISSQAAEPANMSTRCKRLGVDIFARFGFGYPLNTQTDETNRFVLPGHWAEATRQMCICKPR
jgi:cytochrome P450